MQKNLRLLLIISFLGCAVSRAEAQNDSTKEKYVVVPQSLGTVFLMDQQESPLRFEQVQFLVSTGNRLPQLRYTLRNKTSKVVVSFSVVFKRRSNVKLWAPYGRGVEKKVGEEKQGLAIIGASGTYDSLPPDSIEIIPMTPEVFDLFRATEDRSGMVLWYGMVKRVVFADGSVFDTGSLSDEISSLIMDGR